MHEGGLRPGEALGLRLEDISYGRRRVTVRFRDEHPRGVRQSPAENGVVDLLEGRALPAINDYVLRERPQDADTSLVFLVGGRGKRRHEPLSYDGMVRVFARAADRAGVRDLSTRTARRPSATARRSRRSAWCVVIGGPSRETFASPRNSCAHAADRLVVAQAAGCGCGRLRRLALRLAGGGSLWAVLISPLRC